MTAFKDDLLIHDKNGLINIAGAPFFHYTRPTGTNLIAMPDASVYPAEGAYVPYLFGTANRYDLLNNVYEMVKYHDREQEGYKLFLYFDGKKLRKTTIKEMYSIAQEYSNRIIATWKTALNQVA